MTTLHLPHHGKFVSYLRVSTDRQGADGYGIEAQRSAVAQHVNGAAWQSLGEFVEVESGKRADRPQLAAALALCRKHKAKLVVARLDRLSRNVAFLSALMESKVAFVACDNPHATKLTIHILAAVAEHEREMISARTKAALAAAKARGVVLGGPNLAALRGKGAATNRRMAAQRAANVLPVINSIRRDKPYMSLRGIARELTARGVKTARGSIDWSAVTVSKVLARAEAST
jgi:DNA invertase Pin-like site-specific DNA recombinase